MIRYLNGVNVLAMLGDAGYSSYRLRQDRIMGERAIQKIRDRELPSWRELDILCGLLHCHPCDLLEYVPEPRPTD